VTGVQTCALPISYQHWINNVEDYSFVAPVENSEINPTSLPTLSIVIPMFNTKDKYLLPLLYSIINQSYSRWRLILADASTDNERATAIKSAAMQDKRIEYVRLKKNEGISGNTNKGLKHVKTEYVVFMDHDDTINPHALNEIAATIIDKPKVDIIYSDEDKLTDDGGVRHTPHFKPDWSPHQYLSCNWTSHLSAVRSELAKLVGGLRPEMDGAQDYDFILRMLALPGDRVVMHIPKVLYHWRQAEGSTAGNFDNKGYAVVAGQKALTDFVKAKGWNGSVQNIKDRPGFYVIKFQSKQYRKVVVILNASIDERLNRSLLGRLQVSSSSMSAVKFFTKQDFETSKKEILSDLSADDHIFTINGYYSAIDTKWIDDLSGVLELDDVRAVSPRILTIYDTIKDMGIVVDGQGQEHELFQNLHCQAGTVFGHVEWIRDVSRVTGRFYGVKKSEWENMQKDGITIEKDAGKYDVVWSHVNFRLITENLDNSIFLNKNLMIDKNSGEPNTWVK
jgi:glycosyltransferase involved in cell wall biosynthesis